MVDRNVLDFRHRSPHRRLPDLRSRGEWEGGAIIRELPSPVGVFLFGTVRDVMLWLVPPDRLAVNGAVLEASRPELEAIIAPPALVRDVEMLSRILHSNIDPVDVAAACSNVARWANHRGAPNTELAYTQAAAIAQPEQLTYAFETGRLARELSQYQRGETWFKYTIKAARDLGDRRTYVLSYVALGNLYGRVGNGPAAKAMMEFGLTRAERWRLSEEAGRAHHDLIRVLAELGDLRGAYHHAKEAERNYASAPMLTTRLAADVAALWLKVGAWSRAQGVFEAILPHAPEAGLRALWSAEIARCVAFRTMGSVGNALNFDQKALQEYEVARTLAEVAISESRDVWRSADAQWSLALADLGLGLWNRAAATADRALRNANLIGAAEIQIGAERTIEHARSQIRDREALYLSEPMLEPPGLSRIADRLAGTLQEAVGM